MPPLVRVAQARLRRRRWRACIRRPRPAYAARRRSSRRPASRCRPFLGQSLLPDFKERDFLMHWVTKPGTSHPEETRSSAQASRELRAIPGVRNFGAHIGQALLADEVVGINFGENWISVDPNADYDETLANDPGGRRRLPGPVPRRADLPQGADPGGADRSERRRRRAHLRRRPGRFCATRPTRCKQALAGIDGLDRPARRAAGGHPADRGRGRPRRGRALRPQAGRRAPRGRRR